MGNLSTYAQPKVEKNHPVIQTPSSSGLDFFSLITGIFQLLIKIFSNPLPFFDFPFNVSIIFAIMCSCRGLFLIYGNDSPASKSSFIIHDYDDKVNDQKIL
ncbi:MAG: hypothetical protein KBG63_04505, partial [Acetobacterium sp.]|nr:hypothetical protein [Acetobacterium sp.]